MYVDFDSLPGSSRIWIYSGDRKFSRKEEDGIADGLRAFCDQWNAHGEPLKSSFKIEFSQFVIFVVDEDAQSPSGCSIDGSVRVLKSIGDRTGIDFFDRTRIPFWINNEIAFVPLGELKGAFKDGTLAPDALTLNVMARSKGEWEAGTKTRADKSWLSRFIPGAHVS